ncbi:hypothetical protein QTH97_23320 [Variovorax sp. J22R24]|nr:hypothetical protein [Variovorax sp. J22R24]
MILARDAAVVVVLIGLALVLLGGLSRQLPPALYGEHGGDAWFEADIPRVLANMTSMASNHYRTKVHPIASIVTHPIVQGMRAIWPGSDIQAALRFILLVAALWVAAFYALCRLIGARWWEAVCFCALAIGSAAFQFWFSVPETFALGSLSLLLTLLVGATAVHRPVSDRLLIAASAMSLSITVTNWVAGLAVAAANRPWRRALRISAIAFAIIAVIAVVQRLLYRLALMFFLGSREELSYVNLAQSGTPLDKLAGMFWSPILAPLPQVKEALAPKLNWVTVQVSPIAADWQGIVSLALWTVLLVAGARGLLRLPQWRRFALVVGVTLASQVVLHLFYGEETFLYAAHFLPLLMVVTVFARHSELGRIAPVMALVAGGMAAFENAETFAFAAAKLTQWSPHLQ